MEVKLIREHRSNDPTVGYNLTPKLAPKSLHPDQGAAAPLMCWYARPEGDKLQLRVAPELDSCNRADDRDRVRLEAVSRRRPTALLADSRVVGPWALRLDVGLPAGRDVLDMADLDNYAYPLAYHLRDPGLVSVWCTKQHDERSFVSIEAAREIPSPSNDANGRENHGLGVDRRFQAADPRRRCRGGRTARWTGQARTRLRRRPAQELDQLVEADH